MKLKDCLYKTPEMTEEKLLEIINKTLPIMRNSTKNRIQDKKSYLTKSQRDQIVGFVGLCMIKMTKGND